MDFDSEEIQRSSVRSTVENVLRVVAVAALVLMIWIAFHALHRDVDARAEGAKIRQTLADWSTRETPKTGHVVFDSLPTPDLRDWLAALPFAGTKTSWEGATLKPSGLSVEPVADPTHPARIWVAAPAKSTVIIRDSAGLIDSVVARNGGAVVVTPHVNGAVQATVNGTTATAVMHDSLNVKPVLVLGIASWEAKFITTSLEEYGWKVDGQYGLSPRGGVVLGPPAPQIDTAHYSAVVAVDTSAIKHAGAIANFVKQGGGFIAVSDAASLPAFASLLPGTVGTTSRPTNFAVDTTHQRVALALSPLSQLKPDAVPVERRGDKVAVAARRVGMGRVLQVGYSDTWRWRMGGLNDAAVDFRGWWSAMVASVAYAPRSVLANTASVEPTPMASLVSILGPAEPKKASRGNPLDDPRFLPVLFAIMMTSFFLEWASRRLRGQP